MTNYVNCQNCTNKECSRYGKGYGYTFCSSYVYKKKTTNADIIRRMSDEGLAEFLAEEQHRIANVVFHACGIGLEKQVIYARRLEWLRQPVKEDT